MAYFKCNNGHDKIFGNGSLGTVHIDADTNLSTMFPNFVEDTGVFELNCKNFIVDSGKTLTADKRNAGMIIRCLGDCTIHGTIANQRACRTLLADSEALTRVTALYPSFLVSTGVGGAGGASGSHGGNTSRKHLAQLGRFYGGGYGAGADGGGSSSYYASGGSGSSTTELDVSSGEPFVVGYGVGCSASTSGGAIAYYGRANGVAGSNGGGGSGGCSCDSGSGKTGAGGGAGGGGNGTFWMASFPSGSVASATTSGGGGGGNGNYGAGCIILFVQGRLIIDGTINCKGCDGGTGGIGDAKVRYWSGGGTGQNGAGGGAGGGGRIYLMAKGIININDGSFNVAGGTGGAGNWYRVYNASHQPTYYGPYANESGSDGGNGTKHYITYADYMAGNAPTVIAS